MIDEIVVEMAHLNLPRGRPDSCIDCKYYKADWDKSPCGYCKRATLDFWIPKQEV